MVCKLNSFFCVFSDKMTYLGQKFCVVVYPMEDEKKNEESVEEIELKEQSVPLSAEDEPTPKSADCWTDIWTHTHSHSHTGSQIYSDRHWKSNSNFSIPLYFAFS